MQSQIPAVFRSDPAITLRVYKKMTTGNRALLNALSDNQDVLTAWNYLRYKGLPIPCFKALRHTDMDLKGGDLSGTDWRDAILDNVNLAKCDMRYSRLTYLRATGCSFVSTNLDYAAASNMRLTKSSVADISLVGADTRGSPPLKGRMPAIEHSPLLVYDRLHPEALSGGVIVTGPRPKAWLRVFSEYVSARYSYILIPRRGEYSTLLSQLRNNPALAMHQVHLFDKFDQSTPLPHLSHTTPLVSLQCFYVPENDNNRKTRSDAGVKREE